MNILRTIQKSEKQQWIQLLFQKGPHKGQNVPSYPPSFPLPFKLSKRIKGDYLYLVYRDEIIGYGKVARVVSHNGSKVGGNGSFVKPGDMIILAGRIRRMPFALHCRGFTGIRYTSNNLHEIDRSIVEERCR